MVEMESSYVAKVIYLPKKSGERGRGARVSKKGIRARDKSANLVPSAKYN